MMPEVDGIPTLRLAEDGETVPAVSALLVARERLAFAARAWVGDKVMMQRLQESYTALCRALELAGVQVVE